MRGASDEPILARFRGGRAQAGWAGDFAHPRRVMTAQRVADVEPLVAEAEAEALHGRWVVLLLAYEAAPAFDAALAVRGGRGGFPLAWAASFDRPAQPAADVGRRGTFVAPTWRAALGPDAYRDAVQRIRRYIGRGDIYQANFTFPLRGRFRGDALAWFDQVAAAQPCAFHAYVALGPWRVLSFSPELFFERRGTQLTARPMKGTAARGRWAEEDGQQARALQASEKERAENVMIVDLLRNDLGRLARLGSVRVSKLFQVEQYPTVWQMTSTIRAQLPQRTRLLACLRALFPCGSITGAPKVRASAIIAEGERQRRGLYTGAIGLLRPGGDCTFSVAIRTAVVDACRGRVTYGVGSAITYDSVPRAEYAECLLKAALFAAPKPPPDWHLFETLRLAQGRYALLAEHRARLRASCRYFGRDYGAAMNEALERVRQKHPHGVWRVRLAVYTDGSVRTTVARFVDEPEPPWKLAWADEAVDATDPLLYHKTSQRERFERARGVHPDCDDVLFCNQRGELTETTVANLVLALPEGLITPGLEFGLLPGTLRARLLARGRIREGRLRPADLKRAQAIFLINSLRGWIPAAAPPGVPRVRH